MAVVSRPEPSIPTPTIPKRTRSLGATACAAEGMGSALRKSAPEIREAPAAPTVVCKKSRREISALFMTSILLQWIRIRHKLANANLDHQKLFVACDDLPCDSPVSVSGPQPFVAARTVPGCQADPITTSRFTYHFDVKSATGTLAGFSATCRRPVDLNRSMSASASWRQWAAIYSDFGACRPYLPGHIDPYSRM